MKRRENIGKYTSQIHRKGGAFIAKGLSIYGFGSGQIMFLLELYRQDGISQEELSEKLNIDKGTTARALKKLEDEKVVIRLKDENDKRAYKIYLTDKAIEIKENIFKVLDTWDDVVSSSITEDEREILLTILKKICKKI